MAAMAVEVMVAGEEAAEEAAALVVEGEEAVEASAGAGPEAMPAVVAESHRARSSASRRAVQELRTSKQLRS